nr:uridine nucleosidase 1-like [Tanacetum cinerariifolium]
MPPDTCSVQAPFGGMTETGMKIAEKIAFVSTLGDGVVVYSCVVLFRTFVAGVGQYFGKGFVMVNVVRRSYVCYLPNGFSSCATIQDFIDIKYPIFVITGCNELRRPLCLQTDKSSNRYRGIAHALRTAIKKDSSFVTKVKHKVILRGAFFSLGIVNPAVAASV